MNLQSTTPIEPSVSLKLARAIATTALLREQSYDTVGANAAKQIYEIKYMAWAKTTPKQGWSVPVPPHYEKFYTKSIEDVATQVCKMSCVADLAPMVILLLTNNWNETTTWAEEIIKNGLATEALVKRTLIALEQAAGDSVL